MGVLHQEGSYSCQEILLILGHDLHVLVVRQLLGDKRRFYDLFVILIRLEFEQIF